MTESKYSLKLSYREMTIEASGESILSVQELFDFGLAKRK
jgi:hypothetical protein